MLQPQGEPDSKPKIYFSFTKIPLLFIVLILCVHTECFVMQIPTNIDAIGTNYHCQIRQVKRGKAEIVYNILRYNIVLWKSYVLISHEKVLWS